MDLINYCIIALGGFGAGFVNAIAGGGTLISFPILVAVGIPAIPANVTSTVALSPGYLAASFAQWKDLKDQKRLLLICFPIAAIGGIIGGILLLNTGEKLFGTIVPYLILVASSLLAIQEPLKKWLGKHQTSSNKENRFSFVFILSILFASIYGGYFGAGLSVIVLAVLALSLNDSFTRLNALKQAIGFAVNICTALFFVFSGKVLWLAVLIMASGAIAGGWAGGKTAGKIKPAILRYIVVFLGIAISIFYFIS
jgi:uncharacterized protein